MNRQIRQRPTNPLIQRVRRHALMATLFRAPPTQTPPARLVDSASSPATASWGQNLVVGIADPALAELTSRPLPTASLSAPPVGRLVAEQQPSVVDKPSVQMQLQAQSIASVVPQTSSIVSAESEAQQGLALPTAPASATDTEPGWRRLQTIMRRHEERVAAEQTPDLTSTATPTVESTSIAPTTVRPQPAIQATNRTPQPLVQRTPEHPQPLPERRRAQMTYVTEPIKKPPSPAANPIDSSPGTSPVAHHAATVGREQENQPQLDAAQLPTLAASDSRNTDLRQRLAPDAEATLPPIADHIVQTQPGETAVGDIAPQPPALSPALAQQMQAVVMAQPPARAAKSLVTKTQATPVQTLPSAAVTTAPPVEVTPTDPPDRSAIPIQTLSLDAVWPVQRVSTQNVEPETTPYIAPTAALRPLTGAREAEEATIQRVLQHVKTEQPTDSRVEVVAPRRPRPAKPGAIGANMPEAATVQAAADDTTVIQPSQIITEPTLIQTAIGPLPDDLWTLIGEIPPGSAKVTPQAPSPAETPAAIQRSGSADEKVAQTDASADPLSSPPFESVLTTAVTRGISTNIQPQAANETTAAALEVAQISSKAAPSTQRTPAPDFQTQAGHDMTPVAAGWSPAAIHLPVQPTRRPEPTHDPGPVATIAGPRQSNNITTTQPSTIESALASPATQVIPFTLPAVQRQVAPMTVDTDASSATAATDPTNQTHATTDQEQALAVDTDDLARQIYAQIKRCLVVEWERLRS